MVSKSDNGTTDKTKKVSNESVETKKSTKAEPKISAKDKAKKTAKPKVKAKAAVKASAKTKTKGSVKSGTKAKKKAAPKASAKAKDTSKSKAKVKAKATVNKKAVTKKSKIKKKKQNLLRIYSEMNKLCYDAVDREVLKRFKIIIDTSEEDITKISANLILKDPKNISISSFHENIQPYIKHYLFLYKRENKKK